jgi:nicotinamidase-related amidase
MNYPGIDRGRCGLLIIDVQEKLFPAIADWQSLQNRLSLLSRAWQILGLPLLISEQYPKGLGATEAWLLETGLEAVKRYSKCAFSCVAEDSSELTAALGSCSQWLVVGIEAHVCVLQTVLDLRRAGADVFVAADAIGSRRAMEKHCALEEMRQSGVRVSTVETLLFELLVRAGSDEFRQFSALIKAS